MDIIIANSKNVQERLKKYLNHKSIVIYPPIETEKFKWLSQGDYYLSFGRVDKLKRVGDIVRAFQKMPTKKLIICSGGDDLENVKKLASGYANIQILGWVDDKKLAELIGNCLATIYIPINEDFGMTPLESMSAGKPCLGVYDGGLKESIINEKTGEFIPVDYTIDDIIAAVKWLTPEQALARRGDCEKEAEKFSKERFIREMKKILNV
jgi:glycosyltransferase involved in cell wall biosynthesis